MVGLYEGKDESHIQLLSMSGSAFLYIRVFLLSFKSVSKKYDDGTMAVDNIDL